MVTVCEELATKAELNELKQQLNQLLGKKADGGEIDVIEQGDFEGTLIQEKLDLAESAIQDFGIGTEANGITSNVDEAAITSVTTGALTYVALKGSGTFKILPKATAAAKGTITKIFQNASVGGVTATAAIGAAASASVVASLASIVTSLGLSIAETKVFGFRMDQIEKGMMLDQQVTSSIIRLLDKNQGDLNKANQDIQKQNKKLAEFANTNQELHDALNQSEQNVEFLNNEVEKANEHIAALEAANLEIIAKAEAFEEEAIAEIESLKTANEELTENLTTAKTNIANLTKVIEQLGIDVANLKARNTELKIEMDKLKIQHSITVADIIGLKQELQTNKIVTNAKLKTLEAKLLAVQNSGGGLPVPAQQTIAETQTATLKLANTLSSNPASDNELVVNPGTVLGDNNFSSTFDQIMTGINIGSLGLENMNVDDLAKQISTVITGDVNAKIDTKFDTLGLPDIGINLDKIAKNTDPIKMTKRIEKASETAICRSTKGQGCFAQNIGNPLSNGQKDLFNSLKDMLDFINQLKDLLDQETLDIVKDTNRKINQEFQNAVIEKTILAAIYANTLHNAAMLSTELNESVMTTASGIWDNLELKDYQGKEVYPQNWTKGRLDEVETSENNNEEKLNSQNKLFKINPVTPEWWALRAGSDRPQLVVIFKPKSKEYESQTSRWTLTIPHVSKTNNPKSLIKLIPDYHKGNIQGTLVLKDNSKLVVYAKTAQEAKKYIESVIFRGIIDSDYIPKDYFIKTAVIDKSLKELVVTPEMAKFFPHGQKELNPEWIVFSKD